MIKPISSMKQTRTNLITPSTATRGEDKSSFLNNTSQLDVNEKIMSLKTFDVNPPKEEARSKSVK